MPTYTLPRSFSEAAARLNAKAQASVTPDTTILLRRADNAISVVADGKPIVTFFRDGRMKLCTLGCNTFTMISRINACLPRPYRVRKRGCHARLFDSRLPDETLAIFLCSTVFTPNASVSQAVPA